MNAKRKGIKIGAKTQQTKDVIYEDKYDLQDEFGCDKGYEDGVECDDHNCNYTPCKDDSTSYKDDGSCKNDSTSCKDDDSCTDIDKLKIPKRNRINTDDNGDGKIPKRNRTNTDDNGGGRNLIANMRKNLHNDGYVEAFDLCSSLSSDDKDDIDDNQYDWVVYSKRTGLPI